MGLSVSGAAELAGVDEGTFSRWERGLFTRQNERALIAFLSNGSSEAAMQCRTNAILLLSSFKPDLGNG
jgi:hypothetical protein